jgi:murein DD-endopeptidase MepM/ murein hydrolase activator NlpD
VAGALGACSSDVARFSDNPFSNPFRAGQQVDRTATGSIGRAATDTARQQAVAATAPAIGRVTSQPLAAPMVTGSLPSAAAVAAPAAAAIAAPSAVELASQRAGAVRNVAGWTAAGGTPVTVGAGEGVNTLAARYGVPASAIIAANGLSGGGALRPGSQVIIPVFNQGGAAPQASLPAAAPPVAPVLPSMAPAPRQPVAPQAAAPMPRAVAQPAPAPVAPPRPAQPVALTPRAEAPRAVVSQPAPVPRPAATPRVAAAAPPPRESEAARATPTSVPVAAPAPAPVASPRPVASAAADAARERARAQAEAARLRSEAVKQETARADAQRAQQAQAQAQTQAREQSRQQADARSQLEAERRARQAAEQKLAEAKRKEEADKKLQAEAKAKAEREQRAAKAAADAEARRQRTQTAAAPAASARPQPDPAPVSSIPRSEPQASPAAPSADFRWPARGRVISGFTGRGGNEGINIAVPEGTPVKAAGEGVVAYAGNELKGYGNLVLIRHDNGYVSAYAHNGDIAVRRGERVNRGQVIARSGQTGNVSSPQLHFEIRKGSNPVDPMPYLNN